MNFTVFSLVTAGSFGRSPLFAFSGRVDMFSSTFSRTFSSVIFSSSCFSTMKLERSKFSLILDTAIKMDGNEEGKTFEQTFSNSGELSLLHVKHCLFLKCVSNGNGGGIAIGSDTSSMGFTLENTGFYQCKSAKGDAFYVKTREFTCTRCCINYCYNGAFYINEKEKLSLDHFFISDSKFSSDIIGCPEFKFDFANFTANTDSIELAIKCPNPKIDSCNFVLNSGNNNLLHIESSSIEKMIESCYFGKNAFGGSLVWAPDIIFSGCKFIDDNSKMYSKEKARTLYCCFSDSETVAKQKFPDGSIFDKDNKYSQSSTNEIAFGATNECWDKLPTTRVPIIDLSTNTILSFVIASVLLVGVIAVLCRVCRKSKFSDQMPLIYTM